MRDQFIKDGYLILNGFFDPAIVHAIKLDAQQIFSIQMEARGYDMYLDFEDNLFKLFHDDLDCFINCGKHVQHLVSLHRLGLDPQLHGLLKFELGLGFPNICTRPVLFFNHPKLATKSVYHTVPPHQDWASMQGSLDSLVLWVPLMDVGKRHGTLKVIPGSHKRGLVADTVVESFGVVSGCKEEEFIDVELRLGDALLFSSFLIHKSGIHQGDKIRWSSHFRFNNMQDRFFIGNNYPHPYVYKVKDYTVEDLKGS